MKQERMKILSMVEDGKISVDDATKLLEAISASPFEHTYDSSEIQEKFNNFSSNMDSFAKEIGTKFSETYKDMEPKVKAATRSVVEKTAAIVDDISKSIHESLKTMTEEGDCACNEGQCCECQEKKEEPSDDVPREN